MLLLPFIVPIFRLRNRGRLGNRRMAAETGGGSKLSLPELLHCRPHTWPPSGIPGIKMRPFNCRTEDDCCDIRWGSISLISIFQQLRESSL